MIILKSIPDSKSIELNLLAEYEAYFFIFIAILLIIVLIKTRFFGRFREKNTSELNVTDRFEFENRDVLMQPKKDVNEFEVPFNNFSLTWLYIGFGILFFIAFCAMYP